MRLIILCLLIYLGYRVVKAFATQSKRVGTPEVKREGALVDDVMVKDPFCETYIPRRDGIKARVDGQTVYFCSSTCRDKYLDKTGRNSE